MSLPSRWVSDSRSLLAGFTYDKMLHTTPDDAFDVIMKIHVRAPFRLIRQAAPYFRVKGEQKENRSIVNVSSTSGLHGNVGQANYAAAKSAVIGLTKTICKEWGPFGVRANTIAFGLIHTRCVLICARGTCRGADWSVRNSLTASKEAGATIEVNGKKVALGVPGAPRPETADEKAYAGIPLRRGGTVEDAAGAVLLCVSLLPSTPTFSGLTIQLHQPLLSSSLVCLWTHPRGDRWCWHLKHSERSVVTSNVTVARIMNSNHPISNGATFQPSRLLGAGTDSIPCDKIVLPKRQPA